MIISISIAADDLSYKEGELLVRFAPKAKGQQFSAIERNQILSLNNAGSVKASYKLVPGLCLVKLPENQKVSEIMPMLQGKGEILYVEPNYKIKLLSTFPNDIKFDEQWALHNISQTGGTIGADIDAPEAWDVITDARDIIVAVLDSGISYTHPDLAANMWTNEPELNGVTGADDDGNGYIDDIYGWDFADGDNNPISYDDHGTHVAGIIGAVGNNDEGVTGVCWNVKIMNLKIFPYDTSETFINGAIGAIEYAVENGAKILNNSWGGYTYSQSLCNAIEIANFNGVLFIAAAGNKQFTDPVPRNIDIYEFYPASFDCENIITVMATNHNDEQASYSYYGPVSVDLAAPGGELGYYDYTGILSTVPGGYSFEQGTSMAAPHVAGACALVWAEHPYFTHLQVKEAIINSVDELDSLDGLCASEGRLNLFNALNYCSLPIELTIIDDTNECVDPFVNNTINYTIHYDPYCNTDTNVVIVDLLPSGIEYHSSNPAGIYDSNSRTVTWGISSFGPDNPNDVFFTVTVTEATQPGSEIVNTCYLQGDNFLALASKSTCLDFWSEEIIFVDKDADGLDNGSSWQNAYKDLQDAFATARENETCKAIWIAEGIYKPVEDMNVSGWNDKSFELFDNITIMGHFIGNETDPLQRKLNDVNNQTILNGQIGQSSTQATRWVVKADSVHEVIFDGVIISGGYASNYDSGGLLISDSNILFTNCAIKDNHYYGLISTIGGHLIFQNCYFSGSNHDLYSTDVSDIQISNCLFQASNEYENGVRALNSKLLIEDSLFKGHTAAAIYTVNSDFVISDNSIYANASYLSSAISLYSSRGKIINCEVQNNSSLSYPCCVEIKGSVVEIEKCSIKNCDGYGIYVEGVSNVNVKDCIITDVIQGIEAYGGNCSLTVKGCNIINNVTGIFLWRINSEVNLINNWLHKNGTGIKCFDNDTAVLVRNNTIAYNTNYGIDIYYGVLPNVNNCIIWNPGADDLYDCSASYSCIENGDSGAGNLYSDPCFVNSCVGNFHLLPNSPCINMGTGNFIDETDFDGEDRTRDGLTDMGADEYCWPSADYNLDEVVNFIDFSTLAGSWFANNPSVSLDVNADVDVYDLALLADDWLWESRWGNKYDLNNDNVIDFTDQSILAKTWLLSSGAPDFDQCCDFAENGTIDIYDLAILVENWLWASPMNYLEMMMPTYETVVSNDIIAEPPTQEQIQEIIVFVDGLWDSGELGNYMTYEEYIEFRDSITDTVDSQTFAIKNLLEPDITQAQIEEMIDFVDELWNSGELKNEMTYDEYLDFRQSIEYSLESEY
jgi:subtilisin family serine protease